MDRDESDIRIQVRMRENLLKRDRIEDIIVKGTVVLILVIAVCLAALAMLDGLSVWKTLVMLLLILLVIGAVILEGRKNRKLREEIRELEEELQTLWIYGEN